MNQYDSYPALLRPSAVGPPFRRFNEKAYARE